MTSMADRLVDLYAQQEHRKADVAKAKQALAKAEAEWKKVGEQILQVIKAEVEARKPSLFSGINPEPLPPPPVEQPAIGPTWQEHSLVQLAVPSKVLAALSAEVPAVLTVGDYLKFKAAGRHAAQLRGVPPSQAKEADAAVAAFAYRHGVAV